MMFAKFIFQNCLRQLIAPKEIFTFKSKAAVDLKKIRFVVWFYYVPTGYVTLGGAEASEFSLV